MSRIKKLLEGRKARLDLTDREMEMLFVSIYRTPRKDLEDRGFSKDEIDALRGKLSRKRSKMTGSPIGDGVEPDGDAITEEGVSLTWAFAKFVMKRIGVEFLMQATRFFIELSIKEERVIIAIHGRRIRVIHDRSGEGPSAGKLVVDGLKSSGLDAKTLANEAVIKAMEMVPK